MFLNSGMAIEASIPTMDAETITSMSVKPRARPAF